MLSLAKVGKKQNEDFEKQNISKAEDCWKLS